MTDSTPKLRKLTVRPKTYKEVEALLRTNWSWTEAAIIFFWVKSKYDPSDKPFMDSTAEWLSIRPGHHLNKKQRLIATLKLSKYIARLLLVISREGAPDAHSAK